MDIKETIQNAVEKITKDQSLIELFKKNPVSAVEKVIGKDLPDDVINNVISAVKAKLGASSVADAADKIKDGISGLFGGNK